MSGQGIPVHGGPLDGETADNTEEMFTERRGNVIYVYEKWPDEDCVGYAYHASAALPIGPARIGGET